MGDGFEICSAISILYKEALIVFQTIGSTHGRIIETVRMVVFHHFADSLLEIRLKLKTPAIPHISITATRDLRRGS